MSTPETETVTFTTGARYRVLSKREVSEMRTEARRPVVDAAGKPVKNVVREVVSRKTDLQLELESALARATRRRATFDILQDYGAMPVAKLLLLLGSTGVALAWGRAGDRADHTVLVPTWALTAVMLGTLHLGRMWTHVRSHALRRLFLVLVLTTVLLGQIASLISYLPFVVAAAGLIGTTVVAGAALHARRSQLKRVELKLYLKLSGCMPKITEKITETSPFLDNDTPEATIRKFYRLLSRIPESAHREYLLRTHPLQFHIEARQYLTRTRQPEASENGRDIEFDHFNRYRARLAGAGHFSVAQTVFLRPTGDNGPGHIEVCVAIEHTWTETEGGPQWVSPVPDWDVQLSDEPYKKNSYKRVVYDHKTLTQFEDGWFIDNGFYDPPAQKDVEALSGWLK